MKLDSSDEKRNEVNVSFCALLPGLNSEEHISESNSHISPSKHPKKWWLKNNSSGNNSIENSKGEHLFCEPWDGLNCFRHKCEKASVEAPHFQIAMVHADFHGRCKTVWALSSPQWELELQFHKSNYLKHSQQTEIDFFSPLCYILGMIKWVFVNYLLSSVKFYIIWAQMWSFREHIYLWIINHIISLNEMIDVRGILEMIKPNAIMKFKKLKLWEIICLSVKGQIVNAEALQASLLSLLLDLP